MTLYDAALAGLQKVLDDHEATDAQTAAANAATIDRLNQQVSEDASERDDLVAQVALAQGQRDSIQAAFDAYKANHPDTPPPTVVADVREFSDFATQSSGQFLAGDLAGKGSQLTTYRMKPTSNTKAPSNLLALMRAGWSGQVVNLSGFTLEGTDQAGVEYQGLVTKGGNGSTITDVTVTGIPGHGSAPTATGGETASLSLLRAGSHTLRNVQLDGRRGATGTGVAATLFETNYQANEVVWIGGRANYATGGFGAAMFQSNAPHTFIGIDFRNNRKAINIEAAFAGGYRFIRCDFRGYASVPYIAQISTNSLSISNRVTFEDCLFDNDQCVVNTYTTAANGGLNGQKDADIQRIDNGVVQPVGPKLKFTHL